MSTTASVWWALLVATALAALHLAVPALRRRAHVREALVASFAGGISVAYVFLHLLPEIAEGNEEVAEVLGDTLEVTPLLDLGIFLVALGGFVLLYGLERRARQKDDDAALYPLHLGTFAVYNALITYTMPLRLRTGVDFAVLFAVAMALHFVLTDRGLAEHYPRRFGHSGRFVLAGALLAGWGLAAVLAPTSTLVVVLLTAALGGSILLNVFKEELPTGRRSSFPAFLVGVVLYAALLALVTAAAE